MLNKIIFFVCLFKIKINNMNKIYITLLALAFCLNGNAQCSISMSISTAGSNFVLPVDTLPVCTGSTLFASYATSYTWMPGSINTNTITAPNTPTNYTLTVMSGTCTATYTFTTKINPPLINQNVTHIYATMNPVCIGVTDSLDAEPEVNNYSYTWLPANEVVVNPVYQFQVAATCTTTTTYTVTNHIGGCMGGTAVLTLSVTNCSADIEQVTNNKEQVNIYPNPNNGSFVIEPSSATKQTMQVYDVNGKMVLSQAINGKTNIDATSLSEGVYNIS